MGTSCQMVINIYICSNDVLWTRVLISRDFYNQKLNNKKVSHDTASFL